MAVIFEKHIQLSWGSSTTSATFDYKLDYSYVDTSKYSNATFYFEAIIKTSAGTASFDIADSTPTEVSGSLITTTSTSYVRVRSSALTFPSAGNYRAGFKTTSGTASYDYGRVVIVQNGSAMANTETQVPLLNNTSVATTSATYVTFGSTYWSRWLYTSANWNGTVNAYTEAYMKTSAATGYVAITPTGSATAVTNSEITTTSTTSTLVRGSSSFWANLVAATEYEPRFKNDGTNTTTCSTMKIEIQQSASPTKSEADMMINAGGLTYSATAGYLDVGLYTYFDPANWSVDTKNFYFDTTYNDNGTAHNVDLYNLTAAAETTGSLISTSTGINRTRSGAMTMPAAAQNISSRYDSGSSTIYSGGDRILAVLVWTNVSATITGGTLSLLGVG